jgi:hypothetical protein
MDGKYSKNVPYNRKRRKDMKTKASILIALVLVGTLMFLPTPAQATTPVELVITAELNYFTTGTFEANSPLFSDTGVAYQEFSIKGGTIHGVKTLYGADGTITIKFQARLINDGLTAIGTFVIVSGTGAYEKLHGVGDTYAVIVDPVLGHITATYTGTAHFD